MLRDVAHEIEALADRREHPEAEDVDLEEAERVDVVLVPRDDRALVHRRRLDRRDRGQGRRREHEAADVDREVPWETLDRPRHHERLADARIARLEPDRAEARLADRADAVPPRHDTREAIDLLERKAEDLANLTERALRPVRDDLADHRRAIASIGLVDLLDDLLAALVLEVDVDVGRLAALRREEPLEEHVGARRIDRGDPEAEAHRAVRRAPAALTEDVAAAGHVDDGADAEEVRRDLELLDERELLLDLRRNGLRDRRPIARMRALVGETAKCLPRRLRPLAFALASPEVTVDEVGDLVREAIRELLHREAAAIGDEARARDPCGVEGEDARDLLLALEVGLGVRQKLAPCLVERLALSNAVEDVEHRLVAGTRVEDAVRRADRQAVRARGRERPIDAGAVLAVLVEMHGNGEARTERAHETRPRGLGEERRVGERPETFGVRADEPERHAGERVAWEVFLVEVVRAPGRQRLRVPVVALREDLAEVRVAGVVLDEHGERRGFARDLGHALEPFSFQRELTTDDDADAVLRPLLVRADDPVEAVAVGDRDRVVAELGSAMHHDLGRRRAREEAEARSRRELDVAARP